MQELFDQLTEKKNQLKNVKAQFDSLHDEKLEWESKQANAKMEFNSNRSKVLEALDSDKINLRPTLLSKLIQSHSAHEEAQRMVFKLEKLEYEPNRKASVLRSEISELKRQIIDAILKGEGEV